MNRIVELSILCAIFIPIIVSALLFFICPKKNTAPTVLIILLINVSLLFVGLYILYEEEYVLYSTILSIHIVQFLLVFPGIYLYIQCSINNQYFFWNYRKHLFPVFLIIPHVVVFYFILNQADRISFISNHRYHPNWLNWRMSLLYILRLAYIATLLFQFLYYWIKTQQILKMHEKKIHFIYDNTRGINLNGIKVLNFGYLLGAITSMGFYIFNPIKLFSFELLSIIILLGIALVILALGAIGLRQKGLPFTSNNVSNETFIGDSSAESR